MEVIPARAPAQPERELPEEAEAAARPGCCGRWGTLAAISFMLVGLLVMMISEKGIVLTHEEPAVEDDQPT